MLWLIGFIVITIILVTVVLYATFTIPKTQFTTLLNGYWVADQEFLDKLNYTEVELLIDGTTGYLTVAINDTNQLVDNAVTIDTNIGEIPAAGVWLSMEKEYEFDIKVGLAEPFLPSKTIRGKLSPGTGSLTLYKDKTIYAVLYKDNLATSAATVALLN